MSLSRGGQTWMMEIKRFLRLGCLLWPCPFPPFHLLVMVSVGGRIELQNPWTQNSSHVGLLVISKSLLNSFHPLLSEGSLFNLGRNEPTWASVTGEVMVRRPQIWCPCSVGWEDARCPIIVLFLPGIYLTTFRWFLVPFTGFILVSIREMWGKWVCTLLSKMK